MSIHHSKQPNPLSDSFYQPNDDPQDQEMLLDTTQQKKTSQVQSQPKDTRQNPSSKPKTSSFQPNKTESPSKNENNDVYVKKEHLKINADFEDYQDLEAQIQRLKKIKNEYKKQQQSIQKLSKVVQTLKSQNRSLKLQQQSNRQESINKNFLNQVPQNYQTNQKPPGKRILNQNTIKGNLINRNLHAKNINLSHEGLYLSPQSHRRISSNSLRNIHTAHLNNQENILNGMIRIDQEIMIKNHQNNKKSVIANFVQELKQQLQQNQMILQRQKRVHRDTKQKLEACLQELANLRALIDGQKNTDFLERQNIQLRKQLEIETEQRLLAEERLRERQLLLGQYEIGFSTRGSEFDRELDRMDEIYFSIQRTLKL